MLKHADGSIDEFSIIMVHFACFSVECSRRTDHDSILEKIENRADTQGRRTNDSFKENRHTNNGWNTILNRNSGGISTLHERVSKSHSGSVFNDGIWDDRICG